MPTFLGEAPIRPTSLARSSDTVSLDPKPLQVALWVGVLGLAAYALRGYFRTSSGASRRDAIDELAQEARAIQRRNAARRAMSA